MAQAAGLVVGEHDFTSFAAVDPERVERMAGQNLTSGEPQGQKRSTNTDGPTNDGQIKDGQTTEGQTTNVRTIFSSAWTREGGELIYTVRGNGFLHHMVRNLIGTFLLVGKGSLTPGDFQSVLAARNRSAAGATVPASGLYLVNVEYGS